LHYVGFDLHRRTIALCVKAADGRILEQRSVLAQREALVNWASLRPVPWLGAMEATIFTGWVYDTLKPFARELKVAHPMMLRAIAASKKKNDRIDAQKLADALRADLLPECYVAPPEIRELRRVLRYRQLVLNQSTRMKNRIAGLLMECGVSYDTHRLHARRYFAELMDSLEPIPPTARQLLQLSRSLVVLLNDLQRKLVRQLELHPALCQRVERLATIPGVGPITALTWALEVGEVARLGSVGRACSYCGLTSAQSESAGKSSRQPISKQRNKHLQRVLIEAAKLAPLYDPRLQQIHALELTRGHRNRATLIVARKLVAYLLAVDRSGKPFQPRPALAELEPAPSQALIEA
jgi:transposase